MYKDKLNPLELQDILSYINSIENILYPLIIENINIPWYKELFTGNWNIDNIKLWNYLYKMKRCLIKTYKHRISRRMKLYAYE